MWRSAAINHGSIKGREGIQYPIEKLDILINYIGCQMTLRDELEELWDKDRECDMHHCYFLKKITNGEYFYAVYEILLELASAEPAKDLLTYKEGIFTELFEAATDDALDMIRNNEWKDAESTALDLWELYEFSRTNNQTPVWVDDDGKESPPPALRDLTEENWRLIVSALWEEFFWDTDYDCFGHFSIYKEQPHYPTFAEFREALIWLEEAFSRTRANQKAG